MKGPSWGVKALLTAFLFTLPLVTPRIRGADEIEYFAYLRSVVFDRDLEFGNEYLHFYEQDPQALAGFKATFLDQREPRTGRHINFGPVGSAILWAPAYLLAHAGVVGARALGATVPADGFSWPYVAALSYASALLGFLGLLLVRDALVRFGGLPDVPASLAVLALWLGSPVLYYMTLAPCFSHAPSLVAVGLTLWLWLRARRAALETSPQAWAVVGLAGGLAGLVREQDALFLVAPGLDLAWQALRARRLGAGAVRAASLAGAALAAFVPQLLAYKAINGTWGPSGMVRQKMNGLLSPHFFEVLLDPAHGLFVWSPLLLVAVLGLVVRLVQRRDTPAVLLGLAFFLQVWINGAVESWTQAGAFGSRRFVATTFVFAWGLAPVVGGIVGRWGRTAATLALGLFVWWNGSLMVQFGLRLMDRQGLEWPKVAVNQVTEVPARLGRVAYLFFTDRERLVKEGV